MALVQMFVVNVKKSHGRYGAGDTIALKQADFEAYQRKPEHAELVQLLHVDLPNGDRILAEDGVLQEDKVIKAADVVKAAVVKSKVHEMARADGLSRADEERISKAALRAPDAFLKDPVGFIQGSESEPKKNRAAAGPAHAR